MDMMDQKTKEEEIPVRRIDRELKYQGTILKVYQDTVQVNGHEAKWDYIHHNGAAAVVAVTEEGKLLMVRQYRNALDRYTRELWTIRRSRKLTARTENWRRKRDSGQTIWNIF